MVFLQLFIEFFQIGLFAVGGGPATIPFLMDLADKYDWYTKADVANMLAVSESTPGPIGVNMATYAGYNAAGFLGGLVATCSLVLPSIIVVIIVARMLQSFSENKYVKSAFWTIRPAVTGLIATAVVGLIQTAIFTASDGSFQFPIIPVVMCVAFFALMQVKKLQKLHPIVWLAAGAVIGLLIKL
ncbi:MAG: chromate transporter [Lachnospiraceae bacterium]|nr:chromate transporter [Lachnospiraceae bacterium]